LGDIRRREFGDSLDVLGVAEDRRWVLDKLYVSYVLCGLPRSAHKDKENFRTTSMRGGMPVS
jgi:hypothetical protein